MGKEDGSRQKIRMNWGRKLRDGVQTCEAVNKVERQFGGRGFLIEIAMYDNEARGVEPVSAWIVVSSQSLSDAGTGEDVNEI
jgi:hypothetical protein